MQFLNVITLGKYLSITSKVEADTFAIDIEIHALSPDIEVYMTQSVTGLNMPWGGCSCYTHCHQ